MPPIKDQMRACAEDIEAAFDVFLSETELGVPAAPPARLIAAMRYGSLKGGKRLRPLLVRQAAAVFDVPARQTLVPGLAVEAIHCYSLIHDDLPAMDDDDLRRGRPSVHKAFDDATAILAGDALLTHAFGWLARPDCHPDAEIRVRLVAELAAGAGAGGMAGGQMRDIEGEAGGFSETEIELMEAQKTGALIRASVRMGAILGRADDAALAALTKYAEIAGRAYQLADDILDVTATPEVLGKATGKDAARNKQTLIARVGLESARRNLADLAHNALTALTPFGAKADGLRETVRFFVTREN